MMTKIPGIHEMPQVLRARGYRLYTKDNRRLIDLWLNGGTAVLGHTPPNILRELKSVASRGLYAPFPHFAEGRLLKALSKLLPEYSFRLYAAPPQELTIYKIWRPFTDQKNPFAVLNSPLLELVLPTPLSLCVIAAQSEEQLAALPPNDMLSPLLLTAATRGVYDLIAASPQRANPHLPRTFKALKENTCPWQREGIYLTLKQAPSPEIWTALFDKFLKAGFLLPPTPDLPVILPREMSPGEDVKLAAVLGYTAS